MKSAEKFIQDIARQAGDVVLKRFGKEGIHYMKSDNRFDAVTKGDLLSERIIISAIKKRYPEHSIISEEHGAINEGTEYTWVIDPIDGTLNYSSGVPMFGVMICLVRHEKILLSVIYLPALGELFFAKAGGGTFVNGERAHCSRMRTMRHTYGVASASMRGRTAKLIKRFIKYAVGRDMQMNSFGTMSVNVCYVASGRRDWAVPLAGSLWDFAPAYLILKEAGCQVTDTKGKPWKFGMLEMVAANPVLHKELLKLTKNI